MKNSRSPYLHALGITEWHERREKVQEIPSLETHAIDWEALQQQVAICTRCALHQGRTQTVFGVGNTQAKLMIIGEAPGFNEDIQGEPFVGRAGQLLNLMLQAIGFERKEVYIANVLKCRPPNNRDPLAEEVKTCTTYLDQQIAYIKPRLLLAVGRVAAHYLLSTKSSLESLRNKVYEYGDKQTPLIVSYHPAYLLRNPSDKKKAFFDLRFAQQTLNQLMSDNTHGRLSATANLLL